jgi:hypothetical protein
MRELRVQSGGKPIRVFYAFDPRRTAILLLGGDKTGDEPVLRSHDPGRRQAIRCLYRRTEEGGLDLMAGHRPFKELTKGFSEARKTRVVAGVSELKREMALHELRQARERSQQDLARELKVGQPAVAKLERRADMYVSNLRRYVEALGGSLEITARFPEGSVSIINFGELADTPVQPGPAAQASRKPVARRG